MRNLKRIYTIIDDIKDAILLKVILNLILNISIFSSFISKSKNSRLLSIFALSSSFLLELIFFFINLKFINDFLVGFSLIETMVDNYSHIEKLQREICDLEIKKISKKNDKDNIS